jgi:hypothetical protein
MLAAVPLLVLVVGAYNFMAITGIETQWQLANFVMPSGALLGFHLGDLLVIVGIFLLFLEIWKSTRTDNRSVLDHLLSMGLFVVVLVEFLLFQAFGTTTYVMILCLCFVDVIAGFTVSISSARRDLELR